MRKLFNFFAAALVMLAAASCEKNEVLPDNNSEGKVVTLKASINNGGTKTSLGPGVQEGSNPIQYPVYWSENDAIAVIQGSNVYKFTLKDGAGETSATFQSEPENSFDPSQPYKAFYPFSYVSKENSVFKYTIPTTQTYAENSFASGSVPMVATSSNLNDVLEFTSLSGALKLQLKGTESIKSIEVVSDHNISGTIKSDPYNTNLNTLEFIESNCHKWVTLDCGNEGVQLSKEKETNFIIAISKDDSFDGPFLTVIITDTKGNRRVVRTGLRQIITAENILIMPIVNYDPQENEYIVVENGKSTYYGAGVVVGGAVWAPVNCGYEPASSSGQGYLYGKYYQWGRKDGYAYGYIKNDPSYYTSIDKSDNPNPSAPQANTIYINWANANNNNYTNGWTEFTDPCPAGWQVPTETQMTNLVIKNSGFSNNQDYHNCRYNVYGTWFSGGVDYSPELEDKVFFQETGNVGWYEDRWEGYKIQGNNLRTYGEYWIKSGECKILKFGKSNDADNNKIVSPDKKSYARTIRCVKKSPSN